MTREAGRHFFDGKDGVAGFAELFGDKDTLVIYSFMYGPQRKTGCPMCTSQLSAWDGIAPHVKQRAALVITAPLADQAHPGLWQRARLGIP